MENWIREYRILAGVPGREGFLIGNTVNGRALHVSFDLEKSDTESSNTGTVSISNLNDEHKAMLNEKGCVMEVKAGYLHGMLNTIFIGDVSSTNESLTNADRDIEIELVDGFSNFDKPGSISMNGVITCNTVVEEIKAAMGIESVIITPAASEKLEEAFYDNGYAYVGKMKAALQKTLHKAGLTYTLQDGVLQIYVDGEPVGVQAFVLNSSTGLISIPKRITISESGEITAAENESGQSTVESGIPGYEVEYFLNGAVGINDLVVLESDVVSGTFRVKKQHYSGDNYSGDWKCTSELVEVTA